MCKYVVFIQHSDASYDYAKVSPEPETAAQLHMEQYYGENLCLYRRMEFETASRHFTLILRRNRPALRRLADNLVRWTDVREYGLNPVMACCMYGWAVGLFDTWPSDAQSCQLAALS